MREAVMGVGLFPSPDPTVATEMEEVFPEARSLPQTRGWNPDAFAREQIHALVRRVFFSNTERPPRQVVFSAVDPETDVRGICRWVGETLAQETRGTVAVMGGCLRLLRNTERYQSKEESMGSGCIPPLRRIATQVRGNLWLVPAAGTSPATTSALHSYLGELRREFEYSIVEAPPAGESNETTAMAQFADGVILVLSAKYTRRVAAAKVKETLEGAQAHLLGTILSDRMFPIPERIYRRL